MMEETQQKIIEDVAKQLQLVKYSVNTGKGSNKGDNYVGIMKQILLKGTQRSGEDVCCHFILKQAPTCPERRKMFSCESCFAREINMYENVLPELIQYDSSNSFKVAKLYASCKIQEREILLFEDLKIHGYTMKNRREVLDRNHCAAVMRNLGQLHAFSFVMKNKGPALFEKLSNLPETFFGKNFMDYYTEVRIPNLMKRIMACLDTEKEMHLANKMNEVISKFAENFNYCFSHESTNDFVVIGHGDCWINNIFFKYKDESKQTDPTSVCFVDWQLSRCSSPLLDIVYFLYTATDKEFRENNLQTMYEIYYSSLTKTLENIGESAKQLFPYEEFQRHIKIFSKFGLMAAITLLQVFLSDEDEVLDSQEIVEDRGKYEDIILRKAINDHVYKKRVHDVIEEMYIKEYI